MKRWILVFVALAGSLYGYLLQGYDIKSELEIPTYASRNIAQDNSNINTKVIHYKDIEIKTPSYKDLDDIEILGIDRASIPTVYYKYEDKVRTAQLDEHVGSKYKLESAVDGQVVLQNKATNEKLLFTVK